MPRRKPAEPRTTTRSTTTTAAAIAAAAGRLAHIADRDEEAWQAAALAAIADHHEALDAWERTIQAAPNRRARRAAGASPTLRLPELPDFNKRRSPAIKGRIYGRFVVTGGPTEEQQIHDAYHATGDCRIDSAASRTFVHFRGELALAFPTAEPHEACTGPDASRTTAATRDS